MPEIWLTGICQSLNFAPASVSSRPRTISALLSASCSGKPVVSMAWKRLRKSAVLARSASMAAWEKSEIWSFQRLSPRMEANSGALERVYSHCSASSLLSAPRRAWRSDEGAGAAQRGTAATSKAASRSFIRIEGFSFHGTLHTQKRGGRLQAPPHPGPQHLLRNQPLSAQLPADHSGDLGDQAPRALGVERLADAPPYHLVFGEGKDVDLHPDDGVGPHLGRRVGIAVIAPERL